MKAIRSMLLILAAAAFAAAATITPAHASAMNTTTGAKNTIAAPAAQYSDATCAVLTTAPPATANLLATKAPEDVGKVATTAGIIGICETYGAPNHTALGGGASDGVAVAFTAA